MGEGGRKEEKEGKERSGRGSGGRRGKMEGEEEEEERQVGEEGPGGGGGGKWSGKGRGDNSSSHSSMDVVTKRMTVKWHAPAILRENYSMIHVHVHKYCGCNKGSNNNLLIVQCVHVCTARDASLATMDAHGNCRTLSLP